MLILYPPRGNLPRPQPAHRNAGIDHIHPIVVSAGSYYGATSVLSTLQELSGNLSQRVNTRVLRLTPQCGLGSIRRHCMLHHKLSLRSCLNKST